MSSNPLRRPGRLWPGITAALLFLPAAFAQNAVQPVFASAAEAVPTVLERGPHHRVESWTERVTLEDGTTEDIAHSYTVLATGMHWRESEGAEWQDTVAEFVPVAGGFVAARGPHQVAVSDDLFVEGAVTVVSPEGVEWRSTPLSLALRDGLGNVVVLAEARATKGELAAPNTILFSDAFDGISASVRVVYTAAGVESDVVIHERLPEPGLLGLDAATTEVVVLTEVYGPAPTTVERHEVGQAASLASRTDATVHLGSLRLDRGRAFTVDNGTATGGPEAAVVKELYEQEGRVFLEEAAKLDAIAPLLDTLPGASVPNPLNERWRNTADKNVRPPGGPGSADILVRRVTATTRPSRPAEFARAASGRLAVAAIHHPSSSIHSAVAAARPGVVLDWSYVYSGSGQVFKSGSTYFVNSTVNLTGTVTFEGGTVIKFDPSTSAGLSLGNSTQVTWLAEPYRPVILTGRDDSSVGESVAGSTGTPVDYGYGGTYLQFLSPPGSLLLANLHLRYARQGIFASSVFSPNTFTVRHAQAVGCEFPFAFQYGSTPGPSFQVQNVLVVRAGALFKNLYSATVEAAFITADTVANFRQSQYNPDYSTVTVKSSVLHNVTGASGPTTTLSHCSESSGAASSVFATVGAGSHYIPAGSPIRTAGVLLEFADIVGGEAEILSFNSSAPVAVSSPVSSTTLLTPLHPADEYQDELVRGYHYPRLNYFCDNVTVAAPLYLTNGVVVGMSGIKALQLNAGGKLISGGLPRFPNQVPLPNRLVRVSLVQENPTGLTGSTFAAFGVTGGSPRPEIAARHTEFLLAAGPDAKRTLVSDTAIALASLSLRDCRISSAYLYLYPPNANQSQTASLVNNLFDASKVTFYRDYAANDLQVTLRNSLFRQGALTLGYYYHGGPPYPTWTVKDNLFDNVALSSSGSGYIAGGYNGYTQSGAAFGGTGNKTSLVPDFQTPAGGLGQYYYPTSGGSTSLASLLNSGSQSAAAADLWHYTTRSDGAKDGQNDGAKVDIGFHYRALPTDTDYDGLDDLAEDADGDGVWDVSTPPNASDETNWQDADSETGSYTDTYFSLTRQGGDGLTDVQERLFGSNPHLYDTDNDGFSDAAEHDLGTDPQSNTGLPALLQSWNFSDANGNPTSTSDSGTASAVTPVGFNSEPTLYDGPAAKFTAGTTGVLKYPVSGNFTPLHGALRFTYVPQWYDGDASDAPGTECRLFECGSLAQGQWSLSVSANGRALIFRVPRSGGGTKTAFVTKLPRDDGQNLTHRRAYEIALSWSRGGTWVTINGLTGKNEFVSGVAGSAGEGGGAEVAPASNHLVFGSDADGNFRAQGWLDHVETYNALLEIYGSAELFPWWRIHSPTDRRSHVFSTSAEAGGLRLKWVRGWEGDPAKVPGNYKLERRELPGGAWENVGNFFTHTHLDPVVTSGTGGVREGKYFEYRLHRGSQTAVSSFAAWKGALTAHRGQAILVIEDTLTGSTASTLGLPAAINSFKADLVAEGWSVREFYAPRMNDYDPASPPNWSYSPNWATLGHAANTTWRQNVLAVKTNIYNAWSTNQTGNNVVILLGHVPVPYSGFGAEDGHADHTGAWPSDTFYGDMSVFHWPDTLTGGCYTGCNSYFPTPHLWNQPGDGKWDNVQLPNETGGEAGRLELPVGRIDFGRMPYFVSVPMLESPHSSQLQAEIQLYKRYLAKIAQFRRGQIAFPDDWKAFLYNSGFSSLLNDGRITASRVYGAETLNAGRFAHAVTNDLFLTTQTNLFGLHGGYGDKDSVRGYNYEEHAIDEIALETKTPHAAFLILQGSYFADWNLDNVIIRTCLAVRTNVMATWYSRREAGPHQMDALAISQPLAAMQLATYNRLTNQNVRINYLLGDPTLRTHYGRLPSGVGLSKAFVSGTNRVTVTWTLSPDASAGHAVFRAPNPAAPVWTWMGTVGAGTNTFLNLNVPNGTHAYQVRGLSLRTTGTGSHTNLTLGVTNHITVP